MAMTKQPDGIRRAKRNAAEGKTADEYDIYWTPGPKKKEVHLGHTQRVAEGKVKGWRGFPVKGGEWPEVQRNHTLAVEKLLEAYQGAAKTSEDATVEEEAETSAVLSDADTMQAPETQEGFDVQLAVADEPAVAAAAPGFLAEGLAVAEPPAVGSPPRPGTLPALIQGNEQVEKILRSGADHHAAARQISELGDGDISETSVRRWRKANGWEPGGAAEPDVVLRAEPAAPVFDDGDPGVFDWSPVHDPEDMS